jgi:hypothetical protein
MRGLIASILALAASGLLAAGCAEKSQPGLSYEPPITIEHLAAGLTAPDQGFTLLTDRHTEGRFACPLAVAKFTPREMPGGCELVLVALPSSEQAYWTEQMRGVTAVRDLIFLRPIATRPEGQGLTALCQTAKRLGAPLLLVYAPNGLGPNSAQVFGVLYESETQTVLATMRASSTMLNEEGEEVSPDQRRGDHRSTDARYQAQRQFEGYALACLRELIRQDGQLATTQPHNKWSQPFLERWWIPRR